MSSSSSDTGLTPESSPITMSSSLHETNLLRGRVAASSNSSDTNGSSSKTHESTGRIAAGASTGPSSTAALCSSETPSTSDPTDSNRRMPFSRFEKGTAEKSGRAISAQTTPEGRGRTTDAADHQCPTEDFVFSSPVLLWLLSPFLPLNELMKLRLLSRNINCRWLSPWVVRWMMSNSLAMVFPAQWDTLPQRPSSSQETCHTNHQALQACCSPGSSGERLRQLEQQQPQQEREPQQPEGHLKVEQQQKRELDADSGQQQQQNHQRQPQRVIERMQEDQQQIAEGQEKQQQQEQRKQQRMWRWAVDLRNQSQELHSEQRQCLTPNAAEIQQTREDHSQRTRPTVASVSSTSSHSRVAPCGVFASVAADSSESAVGPAGGPADVPAVLGDSSSSSGDSAHFSAYPGGGGRPRGEPDVVVDASTPTSGEESEDRRKGASFAVEGARRRLEGGGGGEAAEEALTANKEVEDAPGKMRLKWPPDGRKRLHRFNFLQSLLIRHPAAYGCAPLKLRQLTLHMPGSPDAVLSLQQFQTYKSLLEVCSPTLEELHLYDFCSYHAVVDISPNIFGVGAVGGHPSAAAVAPAAGAYPRHARRELQRALKGVEFAFASVFDPNGLSPYAELGLEEDAEAVDQLAETASAGDSAPSTPSQQLDRFSTQRWKLTLSFKMWKQCLEAGLESPADDSERRGWGQVDQGEEDNENSETSPSVAGNADNIKSCYFWSRNAYTDCVASADTVSHSLPAADSGPTCKPPGLSSDLATTVESAGVFCSLDGVTGTETISAPSCLRLTELQGRTSKLTAAAVGLAPQAEERDERLPSSLPAAASFAAEGVPERFFDSADFAEGAAAAAAEDPTSLRRTDVAGDGSIEKNKSLSDVPQTPSVSNDCTPAGVLHHSAAMSDPAFLSFFRESGSWSAGVACAAAATSSKEIHKEDHSSGPVVQSEFSTLPTGADVFHFLRKTVSSLQLRCCFPQLRHLQIYGASGWKTVRPYYSCLACLFLPRDSNIKQQNDDEENLHRDGDDNSGGSTNNRRRGLSHCSQRSNNSENDDPSRNNSGANEVCSSSSSSTSSNTQGQGKRIHRNACRRRSNSRQSRRSDSSSRSRSGNCKARNQGSPTSSTPDQRGRQSEKSSGARSMHSPRESGWCTHASQDHVGKNLSEVVRVMLPDDSAAPDDVKSSSADTSADAAGDREAKERHQDFAFPALEEVYWQDASCDQDLVDVLVATRTKRLRKLSFSTYDPSIISCVLSACVAYPRLFRGLRELDIDGLNFIWPDDEWWWFYDNSWFRFVGIWKLYAMGNSRLAPTYLVPHTLQQLQAQRRQRQQQRCRSAYKATCVEVDADQLQQPEDQERRRRHHHASPRGAKTAGWEETDSGVTYIHAAAFQGNEETEVEEEYVQGEGILRSGVGRHHERRSETSQETDEREWRCAAGRWTSACGQLAVHGESLLNRCEEETVVAQQELRSGSGTTRAGGRVEAHSNNNDSGNRGRSGASTAKRESRRRMMWRWIDDLACSTDEEEGDSQSNEAQPLPIGFEGPSSEVDYDGIHRAFHRLPRIRKLRLLNFVGDPLREPVDSIHILGSFFPDADIEVQGSVFIGRRVLQRLLMKALYKGIHAAECKKKRECRSVERSTHRDASRRGRALGGGFDVARSGGVKGIWHRQAERQRGTSFSVRSQFPSLEIDEKEYSSDDSASSRLVEFSSSPFQGSTPRKINRSRSNSVMLEAPASTISRPGAPRDWRGFIRGAERLSPVGEQYVSRWLRQGLVYKATMKLDVDWTDRAYLRVDGFHRECVAVYLSKVLEGLPYWMTKDIVKTRKVRSLRILEPTDCFGGSDKWPEGYTDTRGYFVPFGRAKDVLEYFTPFLLGLDCFYEAIIVPLSTINDNDDDRSFLSVGERDENPGEEAQDEGSLEGENERENSGGHGNEDAADAETPQQLDEQSDRRSSQAAEEENTIVLRRCRTIHLDHDLAKSVHVAEINLQTPGAVAQRHSSTKQQSDRHESTRGGICLGRAHGDTEPEAPAREVKSVSSVLGFAAHETTVQTGVVEGEAGEGAERANQGTFQKEHDKNVGDCEVLPSSEAENTIGLLRSTEGVVRASAAGDSQIVPTNTVASDVLRERYENFPDNQRRILRLEGVVGLAMPTYRRYTDFPKQSDLVMKAARAYRAETRVLLVTDSTLLFYKQCKEFYDHALAALARDFKAVTRECKESLQVVDYRVYRPHTWRRELGDSEDQTCMPSFIQIFLRNNPEFHLARRLDAVRPVDNELENGLEQVKTTLTAYVWIKKC